MVTKTPKPSLYKLNTKTKENENKNKTTALFADLIIISSKNRNITPEINTPTAHAIAPPLGKAHLAKSANM
ncbi:hypothetical protein PT2222_270003 [Paraburkholderia tropica]